MCLYMYIHSHGGGSSTKKWHRYCLLHTPFGGSLLPREVRGGGTLVSDPLALRFLDARGRAGLCVGVFSGLFFWIEDDGNKRKRRGRGRGESGRGEEREWRKVPLIMRWNHMNIPTPRLHHTTQCTVLYSGGLAIYMYIVHVHAHCICKMSQSAAIHVAHT